MLFGSKYLNLLVFGVIYSNLLLDSHKVKEIYDIFESELIVLKVCNNFGSYHCNSGWAPSFCNSTRKNGNKQNNSIYHVLYLTL